MTDWQTVILINNIIYCFQQNLQPKPMNNFFTQLYFVVFIILGAFFILNLFIGVIIDNFNRLKQQYEDGIGILLTAGQRNWINTLKSAADKKPTRRLTRPTVIFYTFLALSCLLTINVPSVKIILISYISML